MKTTGAVKAKTKTKKPQNPSKSAISKLAPKPKKKLRIEVYYNGYLMRWKFRIHAANGKIMSFSADSYTRKSRAISAAKLIAGSRMEVVVL